MTKDIVTKEELQLVDTLNTTAEKALVIKNDKNVENAATLAISLKTEYDVLEDKRKEYVKPTQMTIDLLNADFKKLTEPREKYIKLLKEKILLKRFKCLLFL